MASPSGCICPLWSSSCSWSPRWLPRRCLRRSTGFRRPRIGRWAFSSGCCSSPRPLRMTSRVRRIGRDGAACRCARYPRRAADRSGATYIRDLRLYTSGAGRDSLRLGNPWSQPREDRAMATLTAFFRPPVEGIRQWLHLEPEDISDRPHAGPPLGLGVNPVPNPGHAPGRRHLGPQPRCPPHIRPCPSFQHQHQHARGHRPQAGSGIRCEARSDVHPAVDTGRNFVHAVTVTKFGGN